MKYADLKMAAKKAIKGNVWPYFGASFLAYLIIGISSVIFVGPLILGGPFSYGLSLLHLDMVRRRPIKVSRVFEGFNKFGESFLAYFLQALFIGLWSLLFIIPGIIAALRYSMTYYILIDHPELNGYEAIQKSKEMMKGHKGELFGLILSFILWILLVYVTLGIAAIYVAPYMNATIAQFYEELKLSQGSAAETKDSSTSASTEQAANAETTNTQATNAESTQNEVQDSPTEAN